MASQPVLTLGSASPRRAALLARLGLEFEVKTVEIEEHELVRSGDAHGSVTAIAQAKFREFGNDVRSDLLLTADTLVACAGEIMGKPSSDHGLRTTLQSMSGGELTIVTAICLGAPAREPTVDVVHTMVRLRPLSDDEIDDYIATGAGRDKAGGLALQAEAGSFIAAVDGCWSNVLGLPVCAVRAALGESIEACETHCCVELCGSAGT